MCEFISWVEFQGKILFLNDKRMSEKESKMRVKFPDKSERVGHGAIRWYYSLGDNDGVQKECTDFSSPSNFPKEIVREFKAGRMRYSIPSDFSIGQILIATSQKAYDDAIAPSQKAYADAIATSQKAYDDAIATNFWKQFKVKKNRKTNWQ